MSKLPGFLRIPVNQYGFIVFPGLLFIGVAFGLGTDGYTWLDAAIIAAFAVLLVGLWWRFHARQSANVPDSSEALLQSITQSGKFAMLAFESEFCLSSTTLGMKLSELEKKHPEQFQVYALSVLKDPGRELFKQFQGRVTPTYVLLDGSGQVVMDFPLILPVERVIYAVNQRAAA
jgi:hypothetical protein